MPISEQKKLHVILGFDENPFAHTNADSEDRLSSYFVRPPYFEAVFGDPTKPQPFVVFAPRGGGKTTQRLMIEKECNDRNVLAITYDKFDFADVNKATDIKLEHHLNRIIQSLLWATIVTIYDKPELSTRLSKHDKNNIVDLADFYLQDMSEAVIQDTLHSLRGLGDKIKRFWDEYFPLIKPGIKAITSKIFGSEADSSIRFQEKELQNLAGQRASLKQDLTTITRVIVHLGYSSTYILVDRVDETSMTSRDAKATFQLIQPLIQDLGLLETPNIGFKFFLWDQLEPLYKDVARTDRIRHEILEWNSKMLHEMWMRRLRAYSNRKVSNLNDISEPIPSYSVDTLVLVFASQSPRDAIRIGALILSEQQEIDLQAHKISRKAINRGLDKFCNLRAEELVSTKTIQDFRKIGSLDFTTPYLANIIFREKQASSRSRIVKWKKEGAIVDVDKIDDPASQGDMKVKLFAIEDIRIARAVCRDTEILEFLQRKYKICPGCGSIVLRDWGEKDTAEICHNCQFDWKTNDEDIETWKYSQVAAERKSLRRREHIEQKQLSFADYLENQTLQDNKKKSDW